MPGQFLELHATTTVERLEAIARARFALESAGAWIIGHQEFSNISLCVRFEIEASRIALFSNQLNSAGFSLSANSARQLADASSSTSPEECAGSLQITFIHSEPDLRTPPPAIPG